MFLLRQCEYDIGQKKKKNILSCSTNMLEGLSTCMQFLKPRLAFSAFLVNKLLLLYDWFIRIETKFLEKVMTDKESYVVC